MGNAILMKGRLMRNKRGQGTLEITIILVTMVCLLYGVINIWMWGNKQIVMRQVAYNNTRVIAGKSHDFYISPVWWSYTPERLRKEDVLFGR